MGQVKGPVVSLLAAVEGPQPLVILPHDNPDPDALASAAALQYILRELAEHHDVFIATAAMDVPVSFDAKFQWLAQHFPFIPPSHIVFCGDKSIIDADDLIDDSPSHFARFRGRGILFSAPHNVHETRYLRVDCWEDVRRLYVGGVERVGKSEGVA